MGPRLIGPQLNGYRRISDGLSEGEANLRPQGPVIMANHFDLVMKKSAYELFKNYSDEWSEVLRFLVKLSIFDR